MKLNLKVSKVTETDDGKVVVRLTPSIIEPNEGDLVSGELFLTQDSINQVLQLNDSVEIDFTLAPTPEEPLT